MGTARLRTEVERLKARKASRRRDIPTDRADFARLLGIDPDPWQQELLRSEAPRILLNCCRQSGKTSVSALLALHRALTVPNSLVLALAPALRQSQELFGKVAGFYRDLGETVPAESERRLGLELRNGSRIESLPGGERTVRGFSAPDVVLVDEAARIPDELYTATLPMLAVSRGRLMLLSTPFGKRGIYHKLWTEGGASWERYEVPATECPRIGEEVLEEARATMSEWEFMQEYMCVFADSEAAVFAHEDVQRAVSDDFAPLFAGGVSPA